MKRLALTFDAFCRLAFDTLRAANTEYLVIGGLAVAVVGEPRTTADVDVVVFGARIERLLDAAARARFTFDRDVERAAAQEIGTLRLSMPPFQLDVILASLPFEDVALRRATRVRFARRTIPVPTPEDLLVFKVVAGRDKDLLDAAGILRRHAGHLDLADVERTVHEISDLAEDHEILARLSRLEAAVPSPARSTKRPAKAPEKRRR